MVTTATSKAIPLFPSAAVSAALRQELIDAIRSEARRKQRALPTSDDELVNTDMEIDSLAAVEILPVVDPLLPFEAGEDVIKPGGYESISHALAEIVPRLERRWVKHHTETGK